MPQKDDQSPATKKDIAMLMQEMRRLYDATEKWKDEILDASENWKKEIVGEFHIVAGQLRGAFADKLQQHEERIVRLEEHAGLAAA